MKPKNNGDGGSPPTLNSVRAGQDTGATFWTEWDGCREKIRQRKHSYAKWLRRGGAEQRRKKRWNVYKLNENIAQGVARAMAAHGRLQVPVAILKGTYRWAVGLGVAGSIGKSGGPGKWVEVPRGLQGLKHQSRMSGQPIIKRDGKLYIKEYELNGVKFDDYKNGILYETKHRYTNFIKDGKEFRWWFDGADEARIQARNQLEAAKGIPVIWRVGADQVEAFGNALKNFPKINVKP